MFNCKDEILCQNSALKMLSHDNGQIALQYVLYMNSIIPEIFRNIINEIEKKFNRVPTADELIYLTSEKLNFDIRQLF